MERALLNLRVVRSGDPVRDGIDFVFEITASVLRLTWHEAIARAYRIFSRRATMKSVARFPVVRSSDATKNRQGARTSPALFFLQTQYPKESIGF